MGKQENKKIEKKTGKQRHREIGKQKKRKKHCQNSPKLPI